MNKAVMISIRPKWCELIASGKKTIEVRKTAPKLSAPFKCYIYCTKENNDWNPNKNFWKMDSTGFNWLANGRIIGEFTCNNVYTFSTRVYLGEEQEISDEEIVEKTCVSRPELRDYEGHRQRLFGWHISDLVIYDKPKEISEFKRWNRTEENSPCTHTKWLYEPCETCKECNLKRPPQSWCYVEELT